MSEVLALVAAAGAVMVVLNFPPLAPHALRRRVNPYLHGLRGRPSGLLLPRRRPGQISARLETLLSRVGLEGDEDIRRRLAAAGVEPNVGAFRIEQVLWALSMGLGGVLLLLLLGVIGLGLTPGAGLAFVAITISLGGLGRDWWLTRRIQERNVRIQEQLPIAVDLIALSILAGESVPASFTRVATGIGSDIGEEFEKVVGDVRAGSPVIEALEALARRIPIGDIERLVDALCTGIEKGAPLADVLRAQADDGRQARGRRLIELGGRREVLMLVPVIFLIMPVVVVYALFPGVVSLDLLVP